MKKTLLAASIAALAFAPAAYAENYQMEGGIGYGYYDFDDGGSADLFMADFTYHFEQVSTAGHPLNEAAFLERSTNVYGGIDYIKDDDSDKYQTLELGVEAFIEDFYVNANIDRNFNPSWLSNTTDFNIKLGFLPMDGLLLTLGYELEEDGNWAEDKDLGTISLGGKFVTPLDGEMALNLEAEVGFQDDNDDTVVYTLGGDLYFNHAVSAGLWVSDTDKSDDKTEFGIRGKYFVTPLVSLEATFINNLNNEKKDTAFGLGANIRF